MAPLEKISRFTGELLEGRPADAKDIPMAIEKTFDDLLRLETGKSSGTEKPEWPVVDVLAR